MKKLTVNLKSEVQIHQHQVCQNLAPQSEINGNNVNNYIPYIQII